tara:strand:- start:949 stop:1623 length:675 start_codon:yes stop_codon:yes gene_type:complete
MKKFDILTFILSIYVIVELWVNSVISYSSDVHRIVLIVDFLICIIFIYDFFVRLIKSENKLYFIKVNWIDLIASVPFIEPLRVGRVFRIIRVLRALRSAKYIFSFFYKKNSSSIFNLTLLSSLLLSIVTSLSIYILEKDINPYFETFEDAFWWSLFTLSTIGYADVLPITSEGKMFTMILVAGGIVLIGSFTAMIVDYFIKDEEINERLNRIENKVDKILKKLK